METLTLTQMVRAKKIRHLDTKHSQFIERLRKAIYMAVFLKGTDITKEDAQAMAHHLKKDLTSNAQLSNLSLEEVEYAIEKGIKGDYGDYYGINNVVLLNFLKQYVTSEERYKAIRETNPARMLTEKAPLSQSEKDQFIKNGIIDKFNRFKQTGRLFDFGNPGYNFLAKKGIINYPPQRREEFKAQARNLLIAQNTLLETAGNKDERKEATALLKKIEADNETDQVIAEAKRLALKQFFSDLIAMGQDITELLD
jgi:hypothetical protein